MKVKTNQILVIVSASILFLYSIIKLIPLIINIINQPRSSIMTIGSILEYILFYIIPYLVVLALSLCGFIFGYEAFNKTGNNSNESRHRSIRKLLFSLFISLSIINIATYIYVVLMSYDSWQMFTSSGSDYRLMYFHFFIIISFCVFGIVSMFGNVLFGLFILFGKENFRKLGLPFCIIGYIYTVIYSIYMTIRSIRFMVIETLMSDSIINTLPLSGKEIMRSVLSIFTIIVVLASFIIVLYGFRNSKTFSNKKLLNMADL